MLSGAIVRALEGDTLVLSHSRVTLAKRLSEQRNADVIREALKDALGRGLEDPVRSRDRARTGAVRGDVADASRSTTRTACSPRPSQSEPTARGATRRRSALELLQNELGARRIDGP